MNKGEGGPNQGGDAIQNKNAKESHAFSRLEYTQVSQ
jgi:hypothetical protein